VCIAGWQHGDHEEVVDVLDGEIPHPASGHSGRGAPVGGGDGAVRGLEVLSLAKFGRSDPLLQVGSVDWTNET
jgi:hypothetical protein